MISIPVTRDTKRRKRKRERERRERPNRPCCASVRFGKDPWKPEYFILENVEYKTC